MKALKLFLTVLICLAFIRQADAQKVPDGYQLSTEGYATDTTASTTTDDTSDYRWDITKPLGKEMDYEIIGECKQNDVLYVFRINYTDAISIRTRYLASDSSGHVDLYTKFGWMNAGLFLPGTTAIGGDTKIPFTLKTGSAVWAFRLGRKF